MTCYRNNPRLSLLLTCSTCPDPFSIFNPPLATNCWIIDSTAGLDRTLIESATLGFFNWGIAPLRCGNSGSRSSSEKAGFAFSGTVCTGGRRRAPNSIPRLGSITGLALSRPSVSFISCSSWRTWFISRIICALFKLWASVSLFIDSIRWFWEPVSLCFLFVLAAIVPPPSC